LKNLQPLWSEAGLPRRGEYPCINISMKVFRLNNVRHSSQRLFSISNDATVKSKLTHVTHINENTAVPTMVDVSRKSNTHRTAIANGRVYLPEIIVKEFNLDKKGEMLTLTSEIIGKKGPVVSTAIVAGVLAVKKTSELIPFCHQIPIDSCDINIDLKKSESRDKNYYFDIRCIVKTFGKTGVEMEALVGVSNAALCIYDMLKAVSHEIVISDILLVSKEGGKSGSIKKDDCS
jgi:molybdenum cofactor biosynthesis protein MoaC